MRAVVLALAAAILFGASTPASKALLLDLSPFQLAGLLYLGAALGVAPAVARAGWRIRSTGSNATTRLRLAGSIAFGGVLAPVLLLLALRLAPASSVSLLLNLEMVATALLGVFFFREHLGILGWFGVAAVLGAGTLLSFGGGVPGLIAGALTAGACLCWGLDNNLTSLIDGISPAETTFWKGVVAGATNLLLGASTAPWEVRPGLIGAAILVGALSYGASIVLYITASQQLGAARSQAIFATAPFVGAALSFGLLREPFGVPQLSASVLLAVGICSSVLDRHEHVHTHGDLEHTHEHRHDDGHHDHEHPGLARGTRHTHAHSHRRVTHSHRHVPDLHHRHDH